MAKKASRKSEAENQESIEASGDAIIIADAIFGGLNSIARAIERLAKAHEGEEVPDEHQSYLDGTRIK